MTIKDKLTEFSDAKRSYILSNIGIPEDTELSRDVEKEVDRQALNFEKAVDASAQIKENAVKQRSILKANFYDLKGLVTDQFLRIENPGLKQGIEGAHIHTLPAPDSMLEKKTSLYDIIASRSSVRTWADGSISQQELSWLLWATQGMRKNSSMRSLFRTVPSGGARHPFETYLAITNVEGLQNGLWRYRVVEHDLELVYAFDDLQEQLSEAALGQDFVGAAPLVFIWTAIPYRTEWRYCTAAHKVILQDSGHLCQNLYLGATALNLGTCAIGAYDQTLMDQLVQADGHDEFVIYCAPVGRV